MAAVVDGINIDATLAVAAPARNRPPVEISILRQDVPPAISTFDETLYRPGVVFNFSTPITVPPRRCRRRYADHARSS